MTVDGALLRQALDTLDDVIYIYDAEGGLTYWNRRLNELYGLCDEELVGMTATEFFEPGDHAAIEAAVAEIIETGETVSLEPTDAGFAVEDDGPGIAPADRERVFDPGVSDTADGTGFGLYIVATIATAHGWTVTATDGNLGGARFAFDLGY